MGLISSEITEEEKAPLFSIRHRLNPKESEKRKWTRRRFFCTKRRITVAVSFDPTAETEPGVDRSMVEGYCRKPIWDPNIWRTDLGCNGFGNPAFWVSCFNGISLLYFLGIRIMLSSSIDRSIWYPIK